MKRSIKTSAILAVSAVSTLIAVGCASSFLKYDKSDEMKKISEFDDRVKIETNEPPEEAATTPTPAAADSGAVKAVATPSPTPAKAAAKPTPPPAPKKEAKKKGAKETAKAVLVSTKHEPELEGQEGFVGRRPIKDPFRAGEKVVHEVSYFSSTAGRLTMSVRPFAQVNGRKSYHFNTAIKTASVFDMFYSVDDYVSAMVDFETLIPSVFTLHVKESGQLREARFLFDWDKKTANYWEKKVTKKDGPEEKKLSFEVPEYSQNIFSAIYYMRVFNWEVGKENSFRVADTAGSGENLIFRGKAIKREKLSTDAGDFNAIKIKPEVQLKNNFKPVGDIFIWLSDDDRKYILRIESKIKIGTLVSEVVSIDPGKDE
ncbi:MAG: DUF3108 domain-containing protein [Bdellovibrionaceae bacterium]|nr:DUF3108 domain-containing protein [Pseudobdellovibrionaceae bacterium]